MGCGASRAGAPIGPPTKATLVAPTRPGVPIPQVPDNFAKEITATLGRDLSRWSDRLVDDDYDQRSIVTDLRSVTSCTDDIVSSPSAIARRLQEVDSAANSANNSRNSSTLGDVTKSRLLSYYVRYVADDSVEQRQRARSFSTVETDPHDTYLSDDLNHSQSFDERQTSSGSYRAARTARQYSDPPEMLREDELAAGGSSFRSRAPNAPRPSRRVSASGAMEAAQEQPEPQPLRSVSVLALAGADPPSKVAVIGAPAA
jgi:hypothetical protein